MRKMKKAFASLLLICMLCPCVSMIVNAASAELRFTDPSTTVGAEVEVKARLSSSSELLSLEASLTYDSSMLRFISGDSTTGGNGTLTLSGTGSGTSMEYILKFQALQEGTAKVEVSQASGTDASGSPLQITSGSSAVTIGPGDPSLIQPEESGTVSADGPQVEVDGVQYVVTNGFSDALIPSGFEKSEMTFEGASCEVITQTVSGESAMYLTPVSGGDADFFLYLSDKGTFQPFEEVEIAADRYLVVLRDDGSVKVPSQYQETTLNLNGKEFTAWQDSGNPEYYMIYGLNSDGQKTLYQYDTVDGTYQRYVESAASVDETEDKASPSGLWGKILQKIEDFLDIAVILGIVVFLIMIVILIVVAVKLRHRNLELDDLYDEYGIDLDEEEEAPAKAKKAAKPAPVKGKKKTAKESPSKSEPAVRVPAKTASLKDEDDFDDFEEEDFDDFDDFDDEDYEDYEEDYGYDNDEPEDMIDDLDELLSSQPKKKRGHIEPDDTFKVDFIDLD